MIQLALQVKPGQLRDQLYWDGDELVLATRAEVSQAESSSYLVDVLAGAMRVQRHDITIHAGPSADRKLVRVDASSAALIEQLATLPPMPRQDRLFV